MENYLPFDEASLKCFFKNFVSKILIFFGRGVRKEPRMQKSVQLNLLIGNISINSVAVDAD